MIALVLQSAPKKDFAIAKVREGAAGGQMPRLSKEFESVTKLLVKFISQIDLDILTITVRMSLFNTKQDINSTSYSKL